MAVEKRHTFLALDLVGNPLCQRLVLLGLVLIGIQHLQVDDAIAPIRGEESGLGLLVL